MNINQHLLATSFVLAFLCFISCKPSGGSANEEKQDKQPEVITPLPDTTFSSVDSLEIEIEVYDSVHDGTLNDLHDAFADAPGYFTFRGNSYRNADFGGKVTGRPSRIVKDWVFETREDFRPTPLGTWGGGVGWTGQPLYVHWPDSLVERFKRESPALTPDFAPEEIIAVSLCGDAYFINFATGKASRQPIDLGNPTKGTPCLDPTFNGNLYVGQAVAREMPVGQTAHNLFTHKCIYSAEIDKKSWRNWHTSDSSPIVAGGFLFWPSEDGDLYKYRIAPDGTMTKHSVLRYKVKGGTGPGVESSMVIYRNYGIFGDNQGNVLCVNLNNMKPVWRYNNHDDIDASIVLDIENDKPVIYVTCEVDRQGHTGLCHIAKLNALNGTSLWKHDIPCNRQEIGTKHFDGGVYSTPLLGKGNCQGRIYMSVCQIDNGKQAHFIALDTKTGNEIFRIPLQYFAWSSPVAFYNEKQELFIFTGDSSGNGYLIDGATGEVLFTEHMANNFESSAVVIGNSMVIGSRGKEIYRFSIL